MRKFGHIVTILCHNDLTIEDAIRFHQMIGGKRKEEVKSILLIDQISPLASRDFLNLA